MLLKDASFFAVKWSLLATTELFVADKILKSVFFLYLGEVDWGDINSEHP